MSLPLFFGLCFGTNFILGFILGATIISSYLILESLLSSTALINAKFYLEGIIISFHLNINLFRQECINSKR